MTYKQAYCKTCKQNIRVVKVLGGWLCRKCNTTQKTANYLPHSLTLNESLVETKNTAGLRQKKAGQTETHKLQKNKVNFVKKTTAPASVNSSQPTSYTIPLENWEITEHDIIKIEGMTETERALIKKQCEYVILKAELALKKMKES